MEARRRKRRASMSRRFEQGVLATTLELRSRILSALTRSSDTELVQERGELRKLVSEMRVAARKSAGLPESQALRLMAKAVAASYYLLKWLADTRRATPGVQRFLEAARVRASD